MDQWKKQSIDNFIIAIENYFFDCDADYFPSQGIVEKLNKIESKYLNENLHLSEIIGAHPDEIIVEILKNKDKLKFANFLIKSKNIEFEINKVCKNGKTVFIGLAESYFFEKNGILIYLVNQLFQRNYIIKNEDLHFVNELYGKIESQDQLENWAILRFAVKLKDNLKFSVAYHKQKELFVILSLKLNKPIYFNFPNLLGIVNNALQFYRESGEIILKAIEYFNRKEQIMNLDSKKGTFKKKLLEFKVNKPIQDKEFEEIVLIIFPELKNCS